MILQYLLVKTGRCNNKKAEHETTALCLDRSSFVRSKPSRAEPFQFTTTGCGRNEDLDPWFAAELLSSCRPSQTYIPPNRRRVLRLLCRVRCLAFPSPDLQSAAVRLRRPHQMGYSGYKIPNIGQKSIFKSRFCFQSFSQKQA